MLTEVFEWSLWMNELAKWKPSLQPSAAPRPLADKTGGQTLALLKILDVALKKATSCFDFQIEIE